MPALNGRSIPDDPVGIVMHLLFDGAIGEGEARDLVTLVGMLDLDVAVSTVISDIAITVG